MERDFCRGWSFCKDGQLPVKVNLPHDAMLFERRTRECSNGDRTGFYPGGRYTYMNEFTLAAEQLSGYVALHFGGIYRHAVIFVNDREVARRNYGYTEFTADISAVAVEGVNRVVVKVDNRLEPNSRWYSGSGIYRPVQIITEKPGYIKDIKVTTLSCSPAVINVECSDADAKVEVLDGGRVVASGSVGKLQVENARLWSDTNPYLYILRLSNDFDTKELSFGIRTLSWSAATGLCVNGERVLLRGGCIHHDNGVIGACSFACAEERRVRILKECGYNAVRSAHNPCSAAFLEACDRLGMYVMDEAFDGWYIPKTHHDYSRDFWSDRFEDIDAMAERDFNHPSVIIYSIGNEITEIGDSRGIDTAGELAERLRSIDPTRPITCGINVMLALWASMGIGMYKDRGSYKPEPMPADSRGDFPLSGSAKFNALAMHFGRLMNIQVATRRADRVVKGIAEKLDILGLNYGRHRYHKELRDNPERMIVGSETYIDDLPFNWEYVKNNNAFIGDFCWVAIDYIGETGIGYWSYPSYKGLPILTGSGAIDLIGYPNAENGFQQVVWGLSDRPYIGVRPVTQNNERPVKKAWRFTNALPSWNWQGCEGKRAVIEVFSTGYRIELFCNGQSIGSKRIKEFRTKFTTRYIPGNIEAVAYDESGAVIGRSELKSGKEPFLQLRPDRTTLRANGQDLCFITVEMADEDGVLCPNKNVRVTVETQGAATLQGLGSGAYCTDESYVASTNVTFDGRCLAVIRAGYEPGMAKVTVAADGFSPVSVEVAVV